MSPPPTTNNGRWEVSSSSHPQQDTAAATSASSPGGDDESHPQQDMAAATSASSPGDDDESHPQQDIDESHPQQDTAVDTSASSPGDDDETTLPPILSELDKVQMILSDLSLLAAATDLESRGKNKSANSILQPLDVGAEKNMKHWLRRAFGLIYTRANVIFTPAYLACHLLLVPSLYIAAIVLFATSHKQAYRQFNAIDVRMTYVVLCLTAVLDVFGLLISELLYRILSRTSIPALCETVPGHNLIDGALESKKPVGRVLNCLGCDDVGIFDRDRGNIYLKVAGMVVLELVAGTTSLKGLDLASYRSTTREKNWTLGRLDESTFESAFGETAEGQMAKSLRGLPFDVSVLRWHIATDLCFRSSTQTDLGVQAGNQASLPPAQLPARDAHDRQQEASVRRSHGGHGSPPRPAAAAAP
jgi:hypothetical protein